MPAASIVSMMSLLLAYHAREVQAAIPTVAVVEGDTVVLPCSQSDEYDVLRWKFYNPRNNATVTLADEHQNMSTNYHGALPRDHLKIEDGNLTIVNIMREEEGEYYCQQTRNTSVIDRCYTFVRVLLSPLQIFMLSYGLKSPAGHRSTSPIATCHSLFSDPAPTLTWKNGTDVILFPDTLVETLTIDGRNISFAKRDLVIESPTRYDHNRTFFCVIEHQTYATPKILNLTVLVNHHPTNVTIRSYKATKTVYCESDGYPSPTYSWSMPGYSINVTGPSLVWTHHPNLPNEGILECTAENGFPPNATARVRLRDLGFSRAKKKSLHILSISIVVFSLLFLP